MVLSDVRQLWQLRGELQNVRLQGSRLLDREGGVDADALESFGRLVRSTGDTIPRPAHVPVSDVSTPLTQADLHEVGHQLEALAKVVRGNRDVVDTAATTQLIERVMDDGTKQIQGVDDAILRAFRSDKAQADELLGAKGKKFLEAHDRLGTALLMADDLPKTGWIPESKLQEFSRAAFNAPWTEASLGEVAAKARALDGVATLSNTPRAARPPEPLLKEDAGRTIVTELTSKLDNLRTEARGRILTAVRNSIEPRPMHDKSFDLSVSARYGSVGIDDAIEMLRNTTKARQS